MSVTITNMDEIPTTVFVPFAINGKEINVIYVRNSHLWSVLNRVFEKHSDAIACDSIKEDILSALAS